MTGRVRRRRKRCCRTCAAPATWPTGTTRSRSTSTRWPPAQGCSRYHFLRSFRAAYGETPGRYLSRRRVERVEAVLRDDSGNWFSLTERPEPS